MINVVVVPAAAFVLVVGLYVVSMVVFIVDVVTVHTIAANYLITFDPYFSDCNLVSSCQDIKKLKG